MSTVTVNISFQDALLADIDATARREARSRSELLREAARLYVRWVIGRSPDSA
jgi:metal-responsive CopG/Arc/MetJ family transcriptional regulator